MQIADLYLVQHLLENSATLFPNNEAVVHGRRRITYSELDQQVNRLANFLFGRGVQKSDRVGILFKNSIEYTISYFAILKSGGIAVPLDFDSYLTQLQTIIADAGIKCILSCQSKADFLQKIPHHNPTVKLVIFDHPPNPDNLCSGIEYFELPEILNGGDEKPPNIVFQDSSPAAILYTSGSTGTPKGVVLSHRNILANTTAIADYLKLSQHDRIMVILPFHYCYGKSLLQTHFLVGGTVVLDNRFTFPHKVLEVMKSERVTGFAGVPSTFYILLARTVFRRESFPHLRYVTQAGGAMAPATIRELAEILPETEIFIMYGATEATARLAFLEPAELHRKMGSIGKPLAGVDFSLVDETGREVAPGEIGEIVAQGPNIMQGYWNAPEETRCVLKEGRLFTGDLAQKDAEGFYYIVGRKKDMVKVSGRRFSTKEVENVIMNYPGIAEVAVIGVADPLTGETLKAYIKPRNGEVIQPNAIKMHCAGSLPLFKIPKSYEIVSDLPRNSSGKIMKEILKHQQGLSGERS
ncbi:acyl--CoA ligase [candidate division KSB1 bacterium]|nr:acyl--CoA ligase [candidate division KSB1 bacterium]